MKAYGTIALVWVVVLGGCRTDAPSGQVTAVRAAPGWEQGPAVGLEAPRIRFTDMQGKTRPLWTATDRLSIVGFVRPEAGSCCGLSPTLVEAASRYWNKPVRVLQVVLPTPDCPHSAGCVEGASRPAAASDVAV